MNLNGLGNTTATTPSWADKLATVVTNVAPALVAARHQDKVMRENFKREKAGLRPLDVDSYKPSVSVGLDKKTLLLIAAVVAALLVYLFTRGRRK